MMEMQGAHVSVVPAEHTGTAGLGDELGTQPASALDDLLGLTAQAAVLLVVTAEAERGAAVMTARQLEIAAIGPCDEAADLGEARPSSHGGWTGRSPTSRASSATARPSRASRTSR
jgi:hypothetical protein